MLLVRAIVSTDLSDLLVAPDERFFMGSLLLPYHEIARHLGGWGRYVDSADELHDALVAAHESGLPACLNVPIKKKAAPKMMIKAGQG
jgi:thiamine pyrophosphate-dependent acetolactate synthase large subunit-like protein